jgi:hypothetical protein
MADQQIEDLTAITTFASDDEMIIFDVSDTTDTAAGTTKRILMRNTGFLAFGSQQTTDFTASSGLMYPVSVGSATENINVTFPSSPTQGDCFGYFVEVQSTTTGSFGTAPGRCVDPATSTVINNESYTTTTDGGSNRWGLWINSEQLIFRYYDATVGWQVIRDGRIPHCAHVDETGGWTHNSSGSWLNPGSAYDVTAFDNAGMYRSSSGDFQVKREGSSYLIGGSGFFSFISDKDECGVRVEVNGANRTDNPFDFRGSGGGACGGNAAGIVSPTKTQTVKIAFFQNDSTSEVVNDTQMGIEEIL